MRQYDARIAKNGKPAADSLGTTFTKTITDKRSSSTQQRQLITKVGALTNHMSICAYQPTYIRSGQRSHSPGVIQRVQTFEEYVGQDVNKFDALRRAYMADVATERTWGSELEGHMLAQAYGVSIVFWTNQGGLYHRANSYGAGERTLHILNAGDHFEALTQPPADGGKVESEHIVKNKGGGDCLYRAFYQAYAHRTEEPTDETLLDIRERIAGMIQTDQSLDLTGMISYLVEEYAEWQHVPGLGPQVSSLLHQYYGSFFRDYLSRAEQGGGSAPPESHKQDDKAKIGQRDVVPRKFLSHADRMIDRIGRLIATKDSIHVAVALDGNVLVMSSNRDTSQVKTAIGNLVQSFKEKGKKLEDPIADESKRRVEPSVLGVDAKRRDRDLKKTDAFRSGQLEELVGDKDPKLKRIKAALEAGLFDEQSADQDFKNQKAGIYLIDHFDDSTRKTIHGEINVTDKIKKRREGQKGKGDDVYIGGTLIDCYDCNRAHKASNAYLDSQSADWNFYSGGTHGNSFPNWYVPDKKAESMDVDTFKKERFDKQEHVKEWWDVKNGKWYGYYRKDGGKQVYLDYRGRHTLAKSEWYYDRDQKQDLEWFNDPVIDWQQDPKTKILEGDAEIWKKYQNEEWNLRAKASQPNRTPHSFGDDSDSEPEDYPDKISTRKKRSEKERSQITSKKSGPIKVGKEYLKQSVEDMPEYVRKVMEQLGFPVEGLLRTSDDELEKLKSWLKKEVVKFMKEEAHKDDLETVQAINFLREWLDKFEKWNFEEKGETKALEPAEKHQ